MAHGSQNIVMHPHTFASVLYCCRRHHYRAPRTSLASNKLIIGYRSDHHSLASNQIIAYSGHRSTTVSIWMVSRQQQPCTIRIWLLSTLFAPSS